MLANLEGTTHQSGYFRQDLHRPATFLYELIEFIANELPLWRDDPARPVNTSETALTEYLSDHLDSAARKSPGWDILKFRTEAVDEKHKGRKIDLAPKPCGITIWIAGRPYTQYQILLPIECKILPTPNGKAAPKGDDRDEREYVINRQATTGGIQRFKAGHHGSDHSMGAMIAYVQRETPKFWQKCVTTWIKDLIEAAQPGWSTEDFLRLEKKDEEKGLTIYKSLHARDGDLKEIELRHLWLQMN